MDILGGSGGLGSDSGLSLGVDQSLAASAQPDVASLSQPERANSTPSSLDQIFNDFATKYNLSPNLLKTVAEAESSLDPNAVSPAGAQGVMQLMPSTAKGLGVTDPFDPAQNIEGGAKYLKSLLDRFDNNLPMALAAYNAGPNAVKRYGGIPPYKETQKYVKKIMDNLVDYTG
jgi:soluble lytic murein transglycosylase-like protein